MGRLGIGVAGRTAGALIVALALLVRLAAPDGWMLAAGGGGPRLVICTGHMPAPAGHPDGSGAPGDGHGDHPCLFAGAHAPTPPSLLAATSTPTAAVLDSPAPPPLADQRPGRGLAAPPPPSQGPPNLA